jgi:hypothetical protein
MNPHRPVFERAHGISFLAVYVLFGILTFLALRSAQKPNATLPKALAVSVGSFAGPFTGAMARDFQSCCWQNSLQLAPYCGGVLVLGTLLQWIPRSLQAGQRTLRLAFWILGWLGWFGGGVISFAHALS